MSNKEKDVKKEWHVLANHSLTALGQRLFLGDKIDGYAFSMFTKCDDGDVLYSTSICARRDEEMTMICKMAAELYLQEHPLNPDFPLDKEFINEIVVRIEKIIEREINDRDE